MRSQTSQSDGLASSPICAIESKGKPATFGYDGKGVFVSKLIYPEAGRLPRHVSAFYDNRGKLRFRYRRTGRPVHNFKHRPGTPEFDRELEACRAGRLIAPVSGGIRRDGIADSVSRKGHGAGRFVYFVVAETGQIKIGLATCADARLKSLQATSPVRLSIAAVCEGSSQIERRYHQRFAAHRLRGEWFEPHPDILAEIARLADAPNLDDLEGDPANTSRSLGEV